MAFRLLLPCLCFGLLCGCTKQAPDEDHDRLLDEANDIIESELNNYVINIDRSIQYYGGGDSYNWDNAFSHLNTLYEQAYITGGISTKKENSPEDQLDSIIYRSRLVQFESSFVRTALENFEVNRRFCGNEMTVSEATILLSIFQHDAFNQIRRSFQSPCFFYTPATATFTRHHTIILSSELSYLPPALKYDINRDIPITVFWNEIRLPGNEYSLIKKTLPFMVEIEIPDDRIEETNFIYVEINLIDPLTSQTFVVSLRSYLKKSDFYDH